jgi:hypothetical protein
MLGDASAQGLNRGSVADTANRKAVEVFKVVKTIMFILGGFGLVGLAATMVFGKTNWKWFAYLATGLAILAAAGAIIDYATGSGVTVGAGNTGFGDTFGN